MEQINTHTAKTHLSSIEEKVSADESVIIEKTGQPLGILKPNTESKTPSRTGFMKGQVSVPPDFDRMDGKEISDIFNML